MVYHKKHPKYMDMPNSCSLIIRRESKLYLCRWIRYECGFIILGTSQRGHSLKGHAPKSESGVFSNFP